MTRQTADDLWGPDAVDHALNYADHDPITDDLAREMGRRSRSLPPGAFRAWTLSQPWPKFCAIVRIVSGEALHDLLDQFALEDHRTTTVPNHNQKEEPDGDR